jgi:hypothetical protein
VQWQTFVWMFLVLKIPIGALLWLVWWAINSQPEPATDDSDGGGGAKRDPHSGPSRPRGPKRGDHPVPRPSAPKRVRARGRKLTRKA